MNLFGRVGDTLRNDRRTVTTVEIRAFDLAIVTVGNPHVRPVEMPFLEIQGDAVGHATSPHQGLGVRAVRIHGEDPPAAQIEYKQTTHGHSCFSLAFPRAPLESNAPISLALKPSSFRTASLCSPRPGARLADTFLTPCTCIGLLMVDVRLPGAPSDCVDVDKHD